MTIPSSVDPTLAPEGHHVASFFIQYVPYSPVDGEWTEEKKDNFAKKGNSDLIRVFMCDGLSWSLNFPFL